MYQSTCFSSYPTGDGTAFHKVLFVIITAVKSFFKRLVALNTGQVCILFNSNVYLPLLPTPLGEAAGRCTQPGWRSDI